MKKKLAIAGLIFVTVVWGGGFVASDQALLYFLPFQIMMIRFLIAAILTAPVGVIQRKNITKNVVRAGVMMGTALFVAFSFQLIGLQHTTASKNAFLTATNVIFVPVIAFLIHKKKMSRNGMFGAMLAVIGVAVLSINRSFSINIGDILTLVGAIGFAIQIFLTGKFAGKYNASVLNFIQMATSCILSVIFLFLTGQLQFVFVWAGIWSVLYLGLVSTCLSFMLQTICQRYVDETKAAIILSMESVFGTFFSILLLHEHITIKMVVGCALILTAVIISNLSSEKQDSNRILQE